MLRKTALLVLAAVLAFGLCACSLKPVPITRAPIEGPEDAKAEESGAISYAGSARKSRGGTVEFDGKTWRERPDRVNILLIGVDKDKTRHEVGRSDMLILCTIDEAESSISFLTIPRDTHAYVYHVSDDGAVEGEVQEKINHAYTYGGGPDKYSAENAMACVSRLLSCGGLLSVPIHYYISIDLDGLAELADVFGGVEVTFDQTIPGVGEAGQTVNLQGPFVRYYLERRHDQSEGEVSRQKHQQTFMKALLAKIKERGAAQNAPELYSIFTRFIRTNLSLRQCVEFASMLDGLNLDEVEFSRVTGEGTTIDGIWYLEPDQEEMTRLVLETQYTSET